MIIILILLFIIYLIYFNKENFTCNTYLNKQELYEFLISNSDNYYNTFNIYDLKVRNITCIHDYNLKINNSVAEINDNNKNYINTLTDQINEIFKESNIIGINGEKASLIPWNIGFIKGRDYEYGLPHTRNNVIIIPLHLLNDHQLLKQVLFHEKIHIYQKLYPKDIEKYLIHKGFKQYLHRNTFNNIRANPDINEWTYTDCNNNLLIAQYIDDPKSIHDVIYNPINKDNYEHPYEFMAYELEDMFFK
jgi:hypothetical protein